MVFMFKEAQASKLLFKLIVLYFNNFLKVKMTAFLIKIIEIVFS